ncbi:MAG: glycosyltransferase family 9 protein [Planctomycetaceae bacterium]|nr:glycosyltransferase family 9 protein [Planctomycetaceae bacterium]
MRFPHAEIAWLTNEQAVSLLQGHRALNRILTVKNNWNHSWNEIQLLRRRLKRFQPEITLDLNGNFSSSFAAWISGAKFRIGFTGEYSGNPRLLNNIRVVPGENHEIDRLMQLLEPFDVYGCSVDFDLDENEVDRICAKEILGYSGIGLNRHYGILDTSVGSETSHWPKERFAELANYLLDQWNLPSFLVWSNQNEQAIAETIVQNGGNAAFLSPPLSVNELASLVRFATILVGPDGPALGLSGAVGTPCVGLFGATLASQVGPYGRFCRSIQVNSANPSLERISTSFVCGECDAILSEILEPAKKSVFEFEKPVRILVPAA